MNQVSLKRVELSEIDRNLSKFLFFNAVEIPQSVPVGGRVKHFYQNWKVITRDPWILQSIKGIEIPILSNPFQGKIPIPSKFKSEEQILIDSEIENLVLKNAVRETTPTSDSFYSNVFLVPKKGGELRPVINLKNLNSFLPYEHFKMEGIQLLRDLMEEGDWLVKLDLKDAYLTINVAEKFRKFLKFFWKNKIMEFTSLPFGIAIAPRVFTKIMKIPIAILRRLGIRLVIYLDDILIMNQSLTGIQSDLSTAVYLLENLGFLINQEKSVLVPSHVTEFLGFTVNSETMTLSLPKEKVIKIKQNCLDLASRQSVSARDLAQLIGRLTATNQAVLPSPLHYRSLQLLKTKALHTGGNYDHHVQLDEDSKQELIWWSSKLSKWNGRALVRPQPNIIVKSDASLRGWGAICQNTKTGGLWMENERDQHINELELKAAFLAIQCFQSKILKKHVLLQSDNKVAIAYINNMGGTKSKKLINLASQIWQWCLEREITLTGEYLPGDMNIEADWESRHFKDKSSWKLDPEIFIHLMKIIGPCTVDLFADRTNAQLNKYFSWKEDPHAQALDAMLQTWRDIMGYAFPPFCMITPCLAKVREEKCQIVIVTPTWQTQPWYPLLLQMSIDFPVLIPMGSRTLTSPQGEVHPLIVNDTLQLAGWKVSGDITLQKVFQSKLKNFSCTLGNQAQNLLTTVPGRNGIAGVWNGQLIPFQPLWPLC